MSNVKREWYKEEYLIRKLLRNDYSGDSRWGIPNLRKIDVSDISGRRWMGCDHTKRNDAANVDKVIHFFTYDNKIEKYYYESDRYLKTLAQYACVLTPDFSLFTDMPLALQLANVFKSRWCGAKWQYYSIPVIPTISWSTQESYDFCFAGIETGSAVAVSTIGNSKSKDLFLHGFSAMKERIAPSLIFCLSDYPFPEIKNDVIYKNYSETTGRKKQWAEEEEIQTIYQIR